MTQNGEPKPDDPVRSAIQSQHPGIGDEIEDAIRTLLKLRRIALRQSDLRYTSSTCDLSR